MIYESNVISLLNEVLGQNARIRKGNEAVYFCPCCNHYKRKLEVNLDTGYWHCWVCEVRGKTFLSLLKRVRANKSQLDRLYSITGEAPKKRRKKVAGQEFVSLPSEFKSMFPPNESFKYRHAISYLKKRGITHDDILRYNIGYCEEGEYKNRVIIPSYNADGHLNFFTSRAFYEMPMPHKSPSVSKDIVGFECFVNWREPITLVEGAFDAIAVRKNVIPLFGKIIPDKLKERIIENHVSRVNMVLDKDAIQKAVRNSQDLQRLGVTIHLIKLDGKDPSVLGFDKINQLIRDSSPMRFSDLIFFKLYE
jgi:hypothetical protein